jgi:hypothetical protein
MLLLQNTVFVDTKRLVRGHRRDNKVVWGARRYAGDVEV